PETGLYGLAGRKMQDVHFRNRYLDLPGTVDGQMDDRRAGADDLPAVGTDGRDDPAQVGLQRGIGGLVARLIEVRLRRFPRGDRLLMGEQRLFQIGARGDLLRKKALGTISRQRRDLLLLFRRSETGLRTAHGQLVIGRIEASQNIAGTDMLADIDTALCDLAADAKAERHFRARLYSAGIIH